MRTSSFVKIYKSRSKKSRCTGKLKTKCNRTKNCEFVGKGSKQFCRRKTNRRIKIKYM